MGKVISLQRAKAAAALPLFGVSGEPEQSPHVVFGTLKDFMRADVDSTTSYACFFQLSPSQALHAKVNGLIDEEGFEKRQFAARLYYDEMYDVVPGMSVAVEFERKPGPNRLVTKVVPATRYKP